MESKTEEDFNNFVSQLLPLISKKLKEFKGNSPPIEEPDESNKFNIIYKNAQQFISYFQNHFRAKSNLEYFMYNLVLLNFTLTRYNVII